VRVDVNISSVDDGLIVTVWIATWVNLTYVEDSGSEIFGSEEKAKQWVEAVHKNKDNQFYTSISSQEIRVRS